MTLEEALDLAATNWWDGVPEYALCSFQLTEPRLCMPFTVYHDALEACLGRGVFTHEFMDVNRLLCEFFLWGLQPL